MGQASSVLQKRRTAKGKIANLIERADQVIIIHYSCESFYDRIDGSSPRITSIAVRNLDTGQTTSFSIHQTAERRKLDITTLEQHYTQLEKLMLDEFYKYVKVHQNYWWLHWNMRDANYGFAAIAHRYKVLGGNPTEFDDSKLYDLAKLLVDMYSVKYMGHPRLENLINKNKITKQNFLNGKEETEAFASKQYVKLHQSTLRKVDIIANILERANSGILMTNTTWRDQYGPYPQVAIELILEKWWIVAILTLIGIVSDFLGIFSLFGGSR
jgi:hypothetical protein